MYTQNILYRIPLYVLGSVSQQYICDDCHDLLWKSFSFNKIAIVLIKRNDVKFIYCAGQGEVLSLMISVYLTEKSKYVND